MLRGRYETRSELQRGVVGYTPGPLGPGLGRPGSMPIVGDYWADVTEFVFDAVSGRTEATDPFRLLDRRILDDETRRAAIAAWTSGFPICVDCRARAAAQAAAAIVADRDRVAADARRAHDAAVARNRERFGAPEPIVAEIRRLEKLTTPPQSTTTPMPLLLLAGAIALLGVFGLWPVVLYSVAAAIVLLAVAAHWPTSEKRRRAHQAKLTLLRSQVGCGQPNCRSCRI